MAMVGVDSGSLYRGTHSLRREERVQTQCQEIVGFCESGGASRSTMSRQKRHASEGRGPTILSHQEHARDH